MKNLLLQAIRFFGLSGIGWFLDFSLYIGLGYLSKNLALNNYISSWAGVTFVFIFATRKVFQQNSRISLQWKYIIYIVYQLFLIFIMSKLLCIINDAIVVYIAREPIVTYSAFIAKIVVTPITMVLNFLVMKGIIERM